MLWWSNLLNSCQSRPNPWHQNMLLKRRSIFPSFFFVVFSFAVSSSASLNDEEVLAKEFLANYDKSVAVLMNELTIASWNYETDINDLNAELSLNASLKVSFCKSSSSVESFSFGFIFEIYVGFRIALNSFSIN